jgi:hypothetical protein
MPTISPMAVGVIPPPPPDMDMDWRATSCERDGIVLVINSVTQSLCRCGLNKAKVMRLMNARSTKEFWSSWDNGRQGLCQGTEETRGTNAGTWVTRHDGASRWTLYRIKAEQLSVGVMWVAVDLTQAHSILRRCVSCGVAISMAPRRYDRVAVAAKPKSWRIVRASGANSIIPLWPGSVSPDTN